MQFWVQQSTAKRNSSRLVAVSAVCLLVLSILTAFLLEAVLAYFETKGVGFIHVSQRVGLSFSSLRLAGIASALSLFLWAMSFVAGRILSPGGAAVAESLEGVLLAPQNADFKQQRLLNVVEEMALASGVPVPPVYVLEGEASINAFAAGNGINDAVLGVTRGALEHLNREELQAVMGHEFSHIRNNDVRLNLRFAQILFGFMCLSELAYIVIRLFGGEGGSESSKGSSKGGAVLLAFAAVCYAAGAIMRSGGSALQATVNRQRELLADASSVQFTRGTALASALKKIGGLKEGSVIRKGAMLKSYSHLFFCRAAGGLFSSHPSLETRIRRLEPSWDGTFPRMEPLRLEGDQGRDSEKSGERHEATVASSALLAIWRMIQGGAMDEALKAVGENSQKLEAWKTLNLASHEPHDAGLLVLVLLLDERPDVREKQLAGLNDVQIDSIKRYGLALNLVPEGYFMPLLETAAPALKSFSQGQFEELKAAMLRFIHADRDFSFREWIVYQLVVSLAGGRYEPEQGAGMARPARDAAVEAAVGLLSFLSCLEEDRGKAQDALDAGLKVMGLGHAPLREARSPEDLSADMRILAASPDEFQEAFLLGAGAVAEHDRQSTLQEKMFLQMAALCLGRPAAH